MEVEDKMRVAVYARVSTTDSRVTCDGRNSATAMILRSRRFSKSGDVTLLTTFGSVAGVRRATREELAAAVGAKTADAVLAFFASRP